MLRFKQIVHIVKAKLLWVSGRLGSYKNKRKQKINSRFMLQCL